MRLDWPALTPALTEIRLFDLPVASGSLVASSQRPAPTGICGLAASWLFNPRRQAHFLRARHKLVCPMPNVRVEAGPAAKCQARTVENSASPLCGPGVLMLGLASNEGLGIALR